MTDSASGGGGTIIYVEKNHLKQGRPIVIEQAGRPQLVANRVTIDGTVRVQYESPEVKPEPPHVWIKIIHGRWQAEDVVEVVDSAPEDGGV